MSSVFTGRMQTRWVAGLVRFLQSKRDYLFNIEVLRNICSDLSMSFDRMGGEFYEDSFNAFIFNAKENDIIQIEISWEDTYLGIISSQSLPY